MAFNTPQDHESLEIDRKFDRYIKETPPILGSNTYEYSYLDRSKYVVKIRTLRAASHRLVDKHTGEIQSLITAQKKHVVEGAIDATSDRLYLIVESIDVPKAGLTKINAYAARTIDHSLLAGVMLDEGVPEENVVNAITFDRGITFQGLPGIPFSMIADYKGNNAIAISVWGAIPETEEPVFMDTVSKLAAVVGTSIKRLGGEMGILNPRQVSINLNVHDTLERKSRKFVIE